MRENKNKNLLSLPSYNNFVNIEEQIAIPCIMNDESKFSLEYY